MTEVTAAPGDEGSPSAVIIRWRDDSPERIDARNIDVEIENTTSFDLALDLDVVAIDEAAGDTRELSRAIGRRVLAARSSMSVAIALESVPLQTVGGDSPFWVRAKYHFDAENPFTRQRQTFRQVGMAEPRRITFSSEFDTANVRNEHAQRAHDVRIGSAKRVVAKRVVDSASGGMTTVRPGVFTLSMHSVAFGQPGTPPVSAHGGAAP